MKQLIYGKISVDPYVAIWQYFTIYIKILLIIWIVKGYGRYKVLKKCSYQHPWFAWIPIVSTIALAQASCNEAKQIDVFGTTISADLFGLFPVITTCCNCVPFAGTVVSWAIKFICKAKMYQLLYARCEGKTVEACTNMGFLSSLFGIIPFVKFLLYNPDKV